MKHLLLVEDDASITMTVRFSLESEGYGVTVASTLANARQSLSVRNFDLILLDLSLPDGDSLTLLQELRNEKSTTPIFMISAKLDETVAVQALKMGAMDYIRKPFGILELSVKIQKIFGRKDHYEFGEIALIAEGRSVLVNDKPITLTRAEFDILELLLQNVERVISREQILDGIGKQDEVFDRAVDKSISRLRTKLEAAGATSVRITSVYGVGYQLEKQD